MSNTEATRAAVMAYAEQHDTTRLAEQAVFTTMATGQEVRGREQIGQFLQYFYSVAFQAQAEMRHLLVDGDHAVLEGVVVGRQLLEFAGIAPGPGEIRMPICVVYDLENNQIVRARIYLETNALRQS